MSAELLARRTTAAAALADFFRWARGEIIPGDWADWAERLAAELRSLLGQLDSEAAQPPPGLHIAAQLAAIQLVLEQVLGDEYADRQYALEQIHEILRGDL